MVVVTTVISPMGVRLQPQGCGCTGIHSGSAFSKVDL
jgi:hypothetical protein